MRSPRVFKSFLNPLFQVLSVFLSLLGEVLVTVYSEYHERVRTQGQQLQQLQAELDQLHKEVSSVRAANSERVAKLVFQRLNEDFVRKPDYALSSVGASIDLEKTSRDYEDANSAYFWNRFSFWNYARPPMVILEVGLEHGSWSGPGGGTLGNEPNSSLEPDVFPGNCWAFEGDQGQVVIRLPGRVQLSDITLQHPPPSVAHTGGANSAPRDFAVYVSGTEAKEGLQVDDETEVFLGKFTFDMEKSEIQTFHLQVCLSQDEGAKGVEQGGKIGEEGSPWHNPFVFPE
ncbi:Sperm-associated antigen 4 protein [Myotis davidii]|uniref:Sperm-associated antigen 4 protein n=1 Tax=Myotis davidii TaxID=225400 RepID=L5LVZ6_MYODS|nr:Sperm-associated antigen 4 protein [Myotis davidii]